MPRATTSARQRDPGRLARAVLALGVLAAAALGGVGFAVLREPGETARADFLRLTAQLGDAVDDEWGRFRVRLGRGALPLEDVSEFVEPVELDPSGAFELSAFDALLVEARRAELDADEPARALELLHEALHRGEGVALGKRGEAYLHALALAREVGDVEAARQLWFDARHAFSGHETRRGWPYLLLTGVAAARAMAVAFESDEELRGAPPSNVPPSDAQPLGARWRDTTREETHVIAGMLLDRWRNGALSLPRAAPRLGDPAANDDADATQRAVDAARWSWPWSAEERVAIEQLREILEDQGARRPRDALIRNMADGAAANRLVAMWGETPSLPPPGTLELQRRGPLLLALRDRGDLAHNGGVPHGLHAALYDVPRVTAAFADAATALLPDGFVVTLDPVGEARAQRDEPVGELVRGREELEAGLGFTLRHRDPEGAMQAGSRRLQWLRAGLFGGAALCVAAAWITARALRREARLARLRRAFVASVSHELRTPVASILLLADNLREGVVHEPDAASRYHALIGREARRLSRLVNDVLDMSRLERGEPARVRLVDTSLAEFGASLGEDLDELAARHGAELRRAWTADGTARLDTEGLRRAILNLVENAMTHGGAPVELRGTSDAEGWEVEVRDHGRGVPAELRPRLFEPFEHAGEHAGTGLGLAIVAALAEAHGGRVEHEEVVGGGARFRLRLPRESIAEPRA